MLYLNWMIFYNVVYYEFPLGYDNVDWYVYGIIKTEIRLTLFF